MTEQRKQRTLGALIERIRVAIFGPPWRDLEVDNCGQCGGPAVVKFDDGFKTMCKRCRVFVERYYLSDCVSSWNDIQRKLKEANAAKTEDPRT